MPVWDMPSDARRISLFLLVCAAFAGLGALNYWLFPRFMHAGYLHWYLENGTMISLGATLLALVFEELELQRDLISANPVRYLAACLGIAGIFFLALSVHFRRAKPGKDSSVARGWDQLVTIALLPPILVVVLAWLLVVSPLNYVVTLLSGAPARQALRGLPTRCVVVDRDNHVTCTEEPADQPVREGAVDVSLGRKPFALTQGVTALLLFIVEILRGHFA